MKYFFVRDKIRLLAVAMTATVLLSFSGSGALISNAASNNTDEYLPVTSAIYEVNPLYSGVIKPEDIYRGPELKVTEQQVVKAENKATTTDEAAAQLQTALKSRNKNIAINFSFDGTSYNGASLVTIADNVFTKALEHTGKGDEGDYLKWGYSARGMQVAYKVEDGKTLGTFSYTMTFYTSAEQEQSVTSKVSQISSNLGLSSKGEYDKILSVYEYVCNNVKYDYGTNLMKYTCYSAAVNNSAVCQGYALLMYRLLNDAGVGCRMVAGNTSNGQHGWNIVKVNGVYYNVDSTWDAGKSKSQYTYFMKSDADFTNHTRWAEYSTSAFNNAYPMSSSSYDTGDVGTVGSIKSVTLNRDSLTIKAGSSETLTVNVNPARAKSVLTWTSSNTGVATVDSSGNVHGVSGGTCSVTVASPDAKFQATCYVTVTQKQAEVEKIKLNKKKLKLKKGKKYEFDVTISPDNAQNASLVWKSSNGKVAKISKNGVVKAKRRGKCTITVMTKDGKHRATCKVTVK